MNSSLMALLHLHLSRATPTMIYHIAREIGYDNLAKVYTYTVTDFARVGIEEAKAEKIIATLANAKILQDELQLIADHHVEVITFWCPQYPALLKQIHIPPVVLYCQGNTALLSEENKIACVGARKAHHYVHDVLQAVIVPMIEQGWVVVSGGAAGADTFAHKITLDAGGKTIVVVGSGLCHVYPPENKALFARVVRDGSLIVSCFTMDTRPDTYCFPMRNRIISGLSRGCLVLQAAAKSGALITAQQALDQSREVFAIPGSIFDPLSVGCHMLLQQGAKLVMSAGDILSEFDLSYGVQLDLVHEQGEQQRSEKPVKKSTLTVPAVAGSLYPSGSIEQRVLELVCVPLQADQIMKKVHVSDVAQMQNILFSMSMDGHIVQDGMGYWKRN